MSREVDRTGYQLPGPSEDEQIERRVRDVRQMFVRRHGDESEPALRRLLSDIDAVLPSMPVLARQLKSLQRPANQLELANHLSILTLGLKGMADEAFGRVLIERVAAHAPTVGALSWATRYLIDHWKTEEKYGKPPSIAKVLEIVAESQASIESAQWQVESLPRLRADVVKMIEGNHG